MAISTRIPCASKGRGAALVALLAALLLGACATTGETKLASSVDEGKLKQVAALESRLPGLINRPDAQVRQQLEQDVNALLGGNLLNKSYQARLWGILAETAWLYQDLPLLDRAIRAMQELDPGQARLAIARSRLAKPNDKAAILLQAAKINPDNPDPFISLELAKVAMAEQRYRDAAAYFDEAFVNLDANWVSLYRDQRNTAFRQKDLAPAQDPQQGKWLAQTLVSLDSMVGLALLQTPYLDSYGKDIRNVSPDLFAKLEKDGYILPGQTGGATQNRAEAAWFLFHIVSRQENRPDLLEGGKNWKTSPIPDLAVDDPSFRCVLGVVQREILNLPDGSNFQPQQGLATGEYLKALERLRTLYP